MSNLTIYPRSDGYAITLKRSGTITKGAMVKISADSTVAVANGAAIHGIALDSGAEGIDGDTITVSLIANKVIAVSALGGATIGQYVKPHSDGTIVTDGAAKTANSIGFVVDVAQKLVAII
jgi:hypothetical protein